MLNYKPYISILGQKGADIIHIDDILYIYSEDKTINFILESSPKEKMCNGSIGVLEKKLKNIPFLTRCHNRYIVNIDKISCIKKGSAGLFLKDGIELPISKTYREQFRDKFGDLCLKLHC